MSRVATNDGGKFHGREVTAVVSRRQHSPHRLFWVPQATKTTGTNSSNAFFILSRRYQSDPKRGNRCHRGTHDELLTVNALQITTQTMTKIMRTAAMQAAITLMEIERAIATKDHTGKDNAHNPPCRGELPPRTNNNDRSSIRPPLLNTIQSSGSTMKISAYKSDAACSNHSQFLVPDSERLETEIKVHY